MIPDTVKVNMQDGIFMAEGPMGKLESPLNEDIEVNIEENIIKMKPKSENKSLLPFWGLQRIIVNNIIVGVSEGFSKKLEMNGVGYRATLKGKVLELMLGFSHPINYDIPEDISVSVDKQNNIEIKGPNKQLVGQTAAEIRSFRGPEPYKGKGIKYADEYINRKEGKKK